VLEELASLHKRKKKGFKGLRKPKQRDENGKKGAPNVLGPSENLRPIKDRGGKRRMSSPRRIVVNPCSERPAEVQRENWNRTKLDLKGEEKIKELCQVF